MRPRYFISKALETLNGLWTGNRIGLLCSGESLHHNQHRDGSGANNDADAPGDEYGSHRFADLGGADS